MYDEGHSNDFLIELLRTSTYTHAVLLHEERGESESSVFVSLDRMTKLKVPAHSHSSADSRNSPRQSSSFGRLFQPLPIDLVKSIVQGVDNATGDLSAVSFA